MNVRRPLFFSLSDSADVPASHCLHLQATHLSPLLELEPLHCHFLYISQLGLFFQRYITLEAWPNLLQQRVRWARLLHHQPQSLQLGLPALKQMMDLTRTIPLMETNSNSSECYFPNLEIYFLQERLYLIFDLQHQEPHLRKRSSVRQLSTQRQYLWQVLSNKQTYLYVEVLTQVSFPGYLAPNDEAENDRLDMHHHLSGLILGGRLVTAPIGESPQRILGV